MCFVCAARDQGLSLSINSDGLLAVARTGLTAEAVGTAPGDAVFTPSTEVFSLLGVVPEAEGDGIITAQARTDAATGSIVEGLTVFQMTETELTTNMGQTWIVGRDDADTITVLGKKNLIDAGAGDDRISVQALNTTVVGGSGADVIEVGLTPVLWWGGDRVASVRVLDFNLGEGDRLDLSGLATALETPGAALHFVGTADFSGVAGEIRYAVTDYVTQVWADLDGDGFSDFRVDLVGQRTLAAEDLGLTAPTA